MLSLISPSASSLLVQLSSLMVLPALVRSAECATALGPLAATASSKPFAFGPQAKCARLNTSPAAYKLQAAREVASADRWE